MFKYAYNASNQLVQTTYPGNLIVKYTYDKYGNKTRTTANDKIVYKVDGYDGLEIRTSFLNKYTTTFTLDSRGFKSDIVLKNDGTVLDQFKMNYEGATGNLLSRTRKSLPEETFGYDDLDRLVSVNVGPKETMHVKYADNGNITSKTGIGQYYYNAEHPHAVSLVDNTDNLISTQDCTTLFNDLNKMSSLQENSKVMTIDYGPNLERCYSILKQGNTILRKVTYMDDYEKVVSNGVTCEFYYIDGDVIVIRQNGTFHAYQSFRDNLGSILSVVDENGSNVFSAEYDAWGKQTVSVNTIGLIRGYGGHEMLNEFSLINMNGRVYDPILGRFLSTDKYIQASDYSQNYNSYSYCLNNPLKYVDPSGNVFVLDDFIAITAMGAMTGAMNAAMSDKPIWRGALFGGLSAAATYGIGSVFGPSGPYGHEMLRAGAHGLSSGVFNALNGDNFWNGLISGVASSGMGSFAQSSNWNPCLLIASTTVAGGAIAWATGGEFLQGALNGLQIGAFNFAEHDDYPIKYYHDRNNNLQGEITEIVVYPNKRVANTLATAATLETAATGLNILNGIDNYSGKVRVGTNGKIYLPKSNGVFYGNQFVKTAPVKNLKCLGKYSRFFTTVEDFANFNVAYIEDGNTFGINSKRYLCHVAGRELGSWGGRIGGVALGGLAGSGAGSVPLGIAGGMAGDYYGGELGGWLSDTIFDFFVH